MNKINYICVSGYKNSGKDTFTKLVKKKGYVQYSLSDPLKEALKDIFLFSHEQVYDQNKKEEIDERWGLSPREALTIIGTELLQIDIHNYFPKNKLTFNRDIFIKRYELWEKSETSVKNIIVSDIRFKHEYDFFKEKGAKFILINRPSVEKMESHSSENDFKKFKFDYVIENDKSVVEFIKKSDKIIKKIMEKNV